MQFLIGLSSSSLLLCSIFRGVRAQEEAFGMDPNAGREANVDLQFSSCFDRVVQVNDKDVQLGQMTRPADAQLSLFRGSIFF